MQQLGLDATRNCVSSGSSLTFLLMSLQMRSPIFTNCRNSTCRNCLQPLRLPGQFSHRFLREMAVFPCQLEAGGVNTLVVADPTDAAKACMPPSSPSAVE